MPSEPHVELRKTASTFPIVAVVLAAVMFWFAFSHSSAIVAAIAGIWLALIAPIRDSMRCLAAMQRDMARGPTPPL